jgi:LmbE family N-acetylglucosaminyl deacetylase
VRSLVIAAHPDDRRKIAALQAHTSQIGERDAARTVKEWSAAGGEPFGMAYAE